MAFPAPHRKPPQSTLEPLMNMHEAMALLHCSYTSIRRMVIRGELPVVRITKRWMFKASDLRDYVRQHRSGLA